jgi:elongation factor Tu
MVDDPDMIELVEEEIRDLLAAQGFDRNCPIIRGSALKASENPTDFDGAAKCIDLLDALDTFVPTSCERN